MLYMICRHTYVLPVVLLCIYNESYHHNITYCSCTTTYEYLVFAAGCQSNNGMGMMAMGGTNSYKHLEQCCHLKQACYQLCGSNKQACDAELDKCMEKSCTELSDLTSDEASSLSADDKQKETEECNKMKGIVSLMNTIGGCNEYDMHQRRTCECIDKEKVVDKMERVLRNFYKKFNPDGVNKVKALVEKTDGKRAMFTKILYGLVKKYPDAIKKKVPDIIDPMKMDL